MQTLATTVGWPEGGNPSGYPTKSNNRREGGERGFALLLDVEFQKAAHPKCGIIGPMVAGSS
jgi:hypothetical protein